MQDHAADPSAGSGPDSATRTVGRYHLLIESSADMVVFVGEDRRILDANRAAAQAYGYPREEMVGLPVSAICHRDDDPSCSFAVALSTKGPVTTETFHRRRDGSIFPVEISAVSASIGSEIVVMGIVRDITERRRRAAFQAILHGIDQRILQSAPLGDILVFATGRLAEAFEAILVQIALKADDGSVQIRAFAGPGSDFLRSIQVRWDDTLHGNGPTGMAIRTGRPQECELATDLGFAPWREEALAHDLRSALALPLVAHGETLGALTIFTGGCRSFEAWELEELHGFADQVAVSILNAAEQDEIGLQRAALDAVANAVVITAADGTIQWLNPAFTRLTGYTLEEARGRTPSLLKSGNHSDAFYREMWRTLLAGQVWHGELYNQRKDGTLYAEEQTITPVLGEGGRATHFVAVKQEITERKKHEERIRHMALHDPLTDLPNRRALEAALDQTAQKARGGTSAAILIIDLDDFKSVNDSHGHFAGDQVLTELTGVLRAALRPGDFLARLGGDEFAVILDGTSLEEARHVAERVRKAVGETRFLVNRKAFELSVSVGLAPIAGDAEARSVMIHADSGLYVAKEEGKNRVAMIDPRGGLTPRFAAASQWALRIEDALRKGRFVLHFQPVVHLGSGRQVHFEALVRMVSENGDIVYPAEFIGAAERFGLMHRIDLWVVEAVLALLPVTGDKRIFVNLSGTSLSDETLLAEIELRIRKANLPPGRLAFEITESTAITDLSATQNWIDRLKALGCLFALDDFGIGFSSFAYLQALPVDYIKIDRSFVHNLQHNATNRAVVEAVRSVAHSLGKEVIAEGVECAAHEAVLREIGIEHGQGFLWGRPGTAEGILGHRAPPAESPRAEADRPTNAGVARPDQAPES